MGSSIACVLQRRLLARGSVDECCRGLLAVTVCAVASRAAVWHSLRRTRVGTCRVVFFHPKRHSSHCAAAPPRYTARAFCIADGIAVAEICDEVAGVRACIAPSKGAELASYQVMT